MTNLPSSYTTTTTTTTTTRARFIQPIEDLIGALDDMYAAKVQEIEDVVYKNLMSSFCDLAAVSYLTVVQDDTVKKAMVRPKTCQWCLQSLTFLGLGRSASALRKGPSCGMQ